MLMGCWRRDHLACLLTSVSFGNMHLLSPRCSPRHPGMWLMVIGCNLQNIPTNSLRLVCSFAALLVGHCIPPVGVCLSTTAASHGVLSEPLVHPDPSLPQGFWELPPGTGTRCVATHCTADSSWRETHMTDVSPLHQCCVKSCVPWAF